MNSSGGGRKSDYASLFIQDRQELHWAFHYAKRLARRHSERHRILIQTSMSPSGPFHSGNFRDTACAHLVHRALGKLGRRSAVLLSFDDFDPFRDSQAASRAELAPYAGRPLAVARPRSAEICRRYLTELRAVGIWPATDDNTHMTHYQWERYTSDTYQGMQRRFIRGAGRLAKLLHVRDPANLFAVYCAQCGRNTTNILSLRPSDVHYSCRSCGAFLRTSLLSRVKPSWALDWTLRVAFERIDCEPAGQDHCSAGSTMDRTQPIYRRFLRSPQPVIVPYGLVRQLGETGKISGSKQGGLTLTDLLRVLPPIVIIWLYARPNCLSDFRLGLSKAAIYSYYDEFDRFLAAAAADGRRRALYELLTDEPLPAGAPLPRFRTVAGRLHSLAYDTERVVAELGRERDAGDLARLRNRVELARAWIAGPGKEHSWIGRTGFTPEPAALRRVLEEDLDAGSWDRARHEAFHFVLFGTRSAPPRARLAELFPAGALAEAVAAYRDQGARPLREHVLARLTMETHVATGESLAR